MVLSNNRYRLYAVILIMFILLAAVFTAHAENAFAA